LNNCMLMANSTISGGIGGGTWFATLNNCVVVSNSAPGGFGGGAGTYCSLNSCTVAFNSARSGGGSYGGALSNCIVYFNSGGNYGLSTLNYSCTTPLPGGTGNITNDPTFVNPPLAIYVCKLIPPASTRATTPLPPAAPTWTAARASSAARWTWALTSSKAQAWRVHRLAPAIRPADRRFVRFR